MGVPGVTTLITRFEHLLLRLAWSAYQKGVALNPDLLSISTSYPEKRDAKDAMLLLNLVF